VHIYTKYWDKFGSVQDMRCTTPISGRLADLTCCHMAGSYSGCINVTEQHDDVVCT